MRRLVYHVATSLDGFIARPDGSTDGLLMDGDFVADFIASIQRYGAVLMGRHTYEAGYAFGLQPGQPAYAQVNPALTNYVFSRSLDLTPTDQLRLVRDNVVATVQELKAQPDQAWPDQAAPADRWPDQAWPDQAWPDSDLWLCGGGDLAGQLLDARLIDELVVKQNPVLLRTGIPLFGGRDRSAGAGMASLQLTDCKPYASGVVRLTYRLNYPA